MKAAKRRAMMCGMAWLLPVLCILPAMVLVAFEQYPEFQGQQIDDSRDHDDPSLIDSEYSSDFLTYLKPFDWEYDWLSHDQGIDITVGSLAPKRFMIYNRVKMHYFFVPQLDFRIVYYDERDLDEDFRHFMFELVYWPSESWGISVFGEPSLYKKEDRLGAALLYRPNRFHEIKLFCALMELDFASYDEGDEAFKSEERPGVFGIVGRMYSDPSSGRREFIQYAVRHETRTRRHFSVKEYDHEYCKTFGSLWFQKEIGVAGYFAGKIQYDEKSEEFTPDSMISTVEYEEWLRKRFLAVLQYRNKVARHEIRPGLAYFIRDWDITGGDVEFHDILPNIWLMFPSYGSRSFFQQFSGGYELTHRRGNDYAKRIKNGPDDNAVEHRLNIRYDMKFRDRASLGLLFTWDLDQLISGEPWEGGNCQFQLFF